MTKNDSSTSGTGAQRMELDEFRTLVRSAFDQARDSGKSDWDEMTSAVLKNRLLGLTDREFSETRYGSSSFIQLVRRVPDLLEITVDHPPFRLKLKRAITEVADTDSASAVDDITVVVSEPGSATPPQGDWRRVRIRDDLWRAVLNYGGYNAYVLDPETGYARPKEAADIGLPETPTATAEDLSSWRREFVASLAPSFSTDFEEELNRWLEQEGRQADLPRPIRGRWIEFLKKKVSGRLNVWFKTLGMPSPSDMLLISDTSGLPPAESINEVVRTRQLRDLIIRAVRTMTYDELAQISLPSFALLRISGYSRRQDD